MFANDAQTPIRIASMAFNPTLNKKILADENRIKIFYRDWELLKSNENMSGCIY